MITETAISTVEVQTATVPEVIFTSQCSSSPSSESTLPLSGMQSTISVQSGYQFSAGSTGVKRGRLLIRQQRVKKDGEIIGENEASNEAYSSSEYLLTVPSTSTSSARIERHASEPSSTGLLSLSNISNQNLLTVVSPHSSYLVKQHSHPLLPSQTTSTSSYQLTRQLSYPNQIVAQQQSASSSMFSSHSPLETTTSAQLLHHHKPPVRSQTMPHYVSDTEFTERMVESPTVVLIPEEATDQESTVSVSVHQSSTMPQQPIHQKQVQMASIRVKTEELQRSISSPLVRRFAFFSK